MTKPEYFQERRISPRFNVRIPINYVDPALNEKLDAYTHDISMEGLGLLVNRELTPGTTLEICLQMTDSAEKISTHGKVVWSNPSDDHKYRIGVKLDGLRLEPVPLVLRTIEWQLNSNSFYSS